MHSVSTTNTWTVCIHFSSIDSRAKLLTRVESHLPMCRDMSYQPPKQRSGENAKYSEKGTFEEKLRKTIVELLPKTKSMQTSGSVFADRNEQNERTKFELKLIKFVDSFLDIHGNFTSNLVPFKKVSLN